jgi:hypothetical protein
VHLLAVAAAAQDLAAASRACSTSTPTAHPTITNQTSLHYAETLLGHRPGAAGRYGKKGIVLALLRA